MSLICMLNILLLNIQINTNNNKIPILHCILIEKKVKIPNTNLKLLCNLKVTRWYYKRQSANHNRADKCDKFPDCPVSPANYAPLLQDSLPLVDKELPSALSCRTRDCSIVRLLIFFSSYSQSETRTISGIKLSLKQRISFQNE